MNYNRHVKVGELNQCLEDINKEITRLWQELERLSTRVNDIEFKK